MAWIVALGAVLVAVVAGVIGMVTHNTPLFIGAWLALGVATLAFIGALWGMLLGVRRDRRRSEAVFDDEPDNWRED